MRYISIIFVVTYIYLIMVIGFVNSRSVSTGLVWPMCRVY